MNQYQHQLTEMNVQKAQKLVGRIDREIEDLKAFLRKAIEHLEAETDRAERKGKLTQLLSKVEDMSSSVPSKVASGVKDLWKEAKHTVSEAIGDRFMPSSDEDPWSSMFNSAEWQHWFEKHPYLDPYEWQDYFRSSFVEPRKWQSYLEDAVKKGIDYATPSPNVPYRFQEKRIWREPVSLLIGQNTLVFTALSGLYLAYLWKRAGNSRRQANIPVGEGSLEYLNVSQGDAADDEKKQLDNRVHALICCLDTLRIFSAAVPICLFTMFMLEMNGMGAFSTYWMLASGMAISVLFVNEICIMNYSKWGSLRMAADGLIQSFVVIMAVACLYCRVFETKLFE